MKDYRKYRLEMSAATLALLAVPFLGQAAQAQTPRRPGTAASAGLLQLNSTKPVAISPQVARQMAAIAEDKAARTPAQKKLSTALIYASRIDRGQPAVVGVPSLRAPKLERDMAGRVLVDIMGTVTPELIKMVGGMGGTVVSAYPRWNAMRAWLGTGWLEVLAKRPDVRVIRKATKPIRQSGSVTSEGDLAHGAESIRSSYGAGGGNSTIGVISDSADFLASSIASGDVPSTVQILQDDPGNTGEGTAMMEIVHDIAPDAGIIFGAGGLAGEAGLAQLVLDLAANGCDIIVDDLLYLTESPFQDGVIAQAVDEVAGQGVLYFSSAGNQRQAVWEGDFNNFGPAFSPLDGAGDLHIFPSGFLANSPSDFCVSILNWSDPNGASDNDYDLYIIDSSGSSVIDNSIDTQDGTQDPIEGAVTFPGELVVIVKFFGAPRALHLFAAPLPGAGQAAYVEATNGETFGHSAANGAFSIAALDANQAFPATFATTLGLMTESFSSTGPRKVFYNADGSPITPGNFLFANGGETRNKPDMTAADGVATSLSGFNPFYGTSAAAPHAAAMAAQLKSLNVSTVTPTMMSYVFGPALTRSDVGSAFTNSAMDIETAGWDSKAGAGVMMADLATNKLVNFVSNLVVKPGMDQVTFTWKTSIPAASSIDVFQGPSDPNPIHVEDPTLTTDHSVTVTGLTLDATYDYTVASGTDSGAVFGQVSGTFVTIFISNVTVTNIGPNQATISWTTEAPASSTVTVSQGPLDPNPITVTDPALVTNHSITVTGLQEESTYNYTLSSDAPGGIHGEKTGSFKTLTLQEVITLSAVLLNKNSSIWQLEVTLKNRSKFTTAKNVKIDSVILNAANTTTKLPFTMPDIAPDGTVKQVFLFNKLKIGTVVSASVTGGYVTPKNPAKRFSGKLTVKVN
jgi:chitodextrinase